MYGTYNVPDIVLDALRDLIGCIPVLWWLCYSRSQTDNNNILELSPMYLRVLFLQYVKN